MSFTQAFWDAVTRLKGYNLGIYNAVSNALGLSGVGGMAANWAKHSKDLATVGEQIATAFGTLAPSVSTIGMTWDTATTAADPGAGKVRATVAPPTAGSFSLIVSTTDASGQDVSALIAEMGASTSTVKARARLVKVGNPAAYVDVSVTGVSGAGAYRAVAVTYLAGPGGFVAGDAIVLGWLRTGDKGDTGAAGGSSFAAGTVAAPGWAVTGDPDTGLAQINGADTLSLIAGGFEIISWIKGLLGLRNNDATATGKTSITLGNSSDSLDAQIILNNAANTAMSGARSLNILANAGKIGLWFNRLAPSLGLELSSTLATFGVPAKAKQASVAYASTITLDFTAQDYVIGDLTGPLTLANPSAYPVGQRGEILVHEDGTGGRTVSFGANWFKVGKDAINTTAGKYSVITYWVISGSVVIYSIAGGA